MGATVSGAGVETAEYSQESETVRTQFDQEKTPASIAAPAQLADTMGTDPAELDPLCSTGDPEALHALVRVRNGTIGDTHVTFTRECHAITVHSYGVLAITQEHKPAAKKSEKGEAR